MGYNSPWNLPTGGELHVEQEIKYQRERERKGESISIKYLCVCNHINHETSEWCMVCLVHHVVGEDNGSETAVEKQ